MFEGCRRLPSFAPSDPASFGARFGLLIRSYREDLGLSAKALAVKIWNDECRKSSISRIENGKVRRPSATTIHAIAYALDIPQQEIDALRAEAKPLLEKMTHLPSTTPVSRGSLEALAGKFGLFGTSAFSELELSCALEAKAEEYHAYRRQFDYLDESIRALVALKARATEAISVPDFERAEELLSEVDDLQTRLLLNAREERAINALRRDQVRQAYSLFASAVAVAGGADPAAEARLRGKYYKTFFEYGVSHEAIGFLLAARLLRPAIPIWLKTGDHGAWARSLQNLANALASLALRKTGAQRDVLFDEAVRSYLAAQEHFTPSQYPAEWGMVEQNLGSALFAQASGKSTDDPLKLKLLIEAERKFENALRVRSRRDCPTEWAMTRQNYAAVLQARGALRPDENGALLLREALAVFEETLSIRTRDSAPLDWAMTRENMALTEADLARHPATTVSLKHVAAALVHVEAALLIYERSDVPYLQNKAAKLRDSLQAGLEAGNYPAV